tara:strand:- start:81 stop:479 length:399 start_codon:yes stop_codon:yes gene_type:complete
MAERFGVTKDEIRKLIREFNRSAWMGTQRPMLESQTWVKLLCAEGWTFIPITSQTSDIPAQQLRKKRMGELFGDHVFANYHILGTGADKDGALSEFHDTGAILGRGQAKERCSRAQIRFKAYIDRPSIQSRL